MGGFSPGSTLCRGEGIPPLRLPTTPRRPAVSRTGASPFLRLRPSAVLLLLPPFSGQEYATEHRTPRFPVFSPDDPSSQGYASLARTGTSMTCITGRRTLVFPVPCFYLSRRPACLCSPTFNLTPSGCALSRTRGDTSTAPRRGPLAWKGGPVGAWHGAGCFPRGFPAAAASVPFGM